jgi:23S rRNA (uracil1939-C5)-methyltransferase
MWSFCLRPDVKLEPFGGEAEIQIERLGAQGEGVATIRGQSIYVPLTAPGDVVRIAYGGKHGRVLERIADGPGRATPPCPHFGTCGGCALQHLSAEAYRRFKEESLRETLAQAGFADPPLAPLTIVPARTRRRATFAFARAQDGVALGFYEARTRKVLDLSVCHLLSPNMEAVLPALRKCLSTLPDKTSGRLHLTLTDSGLDADLILDGPLSTKAQAALTQAAAPLDLARLTLSGALLRQSRVPMVSFDGLAVAPPPGAFLQPSRDGEGKLRDWVSAGVGKARKICDLFSGLGTFALPLGRRAQIHAVDSDSALLDPLLAAARATAGLKSVTVERRDLMRSPLPPEALAKFDAILFDPPRAGAKAQVAAIAKSGVPRVIAVSCNPASFGRDARLLVDSGYHLDWIRPLDQFLWSAHLELVALFRRGKG